MVDTASADGLRDQTLLEAAKAMCREPILTNSSWANLRAAIAREEAKPSGYSNWEMLRLYLDGTYREDPSMPDDPTFDAAVRLHNRAQQAEASAAWHKAESARLSADLARERERHAATVINWRTQVDQVREEAEAAPDEPTIDAITSLRQRAEKAEEEIAHVRKALGAADGELTWMAAEKRVNMHHAAVGGCETLHGEYRTWRDRAERAEAELAKARQDRQLDRAVDVLTRIEPRDPTTGFTFATYRRLLEALGGKS